MKLLAIFLAAGALALAQEELGTSKTGAMVVNVLPIGVQLEAMTGAPFSAEQVSSRLRILPDGTRVEQPATGGQMLYRDGQGRIREETFSLAPPGERKVSMVMISDPVDGFHYTLDPKNKIAHRVKVRVQLPVPGEQRKTGPSGPNVTRQPLGLQIVNGVPAQGELATLTIPAGTAGNDRPMVDTFEIWTSVELQWTVKQVIRGPLRGESTMELLNISRQEPDPLLFRIPPDYQITDDKGPYTIGR